MYIYIKLSNFCNGEPVLICIITYINYRLITLSKLLFLLFLFVSNCLVVQLSSCPVAQLTNYPVFNLFFCPLVN